MRLNAHLINEIRILFIIIHSSFSNNRTAFHTDDPIASVRAYEIDHGEGVKSLSIAVNGKSDGKRELKGLLRPVFEMQCKPSESNGMLELSPDPTKSSMYLYTKGPKNFKASQIVAL